MCVLCRASAALLRFGCLTCLSLTPACRAVEDGQEAQSATGGSRAQLASESAASGGSVPGMAGAGAVSGSEGASYQNGREALVALKLAHALLERGDVESVAILTPYNGQVRCYHRSLQLSPTPCFSCACTEAAQPHRSRFGSSGPIEPTPISQPIKTPYRVADYCQADPD